MSSVRVPDLNSVMIAGNLTRDPELTHTANSTPVCKMGLASNRRFKDKAGVQREETIFVTVTAWGPLATSCGTLLAKGRPVVVEGSLRQNEWEDRETGQKRSQIEITATRVHFLDWGAGKDGDGSQTAKQPAQPKAQPAVAEPEPADDLPF